MNTQPSPKIIGAFVLGFALVAGAYILSNFGQPTGQFEARNVTQNQQTASLRTAIPVTDEDGNGVEDWRDEFVTADPIVLPTNVIEQVYEAPQTLTGQTGINFFEDVVRSRNLGIADESVIAETVGNLAQQTSVEIYDTPDIQIIDNWDGQSIRTYANAMATAIIDNNQTDLEYELLILQDIINRQDESRFEELNELAEVYRLTRDAIIDVPVPALLVKEHLDIINTLHAIHNDIKAMTLSFEDPAFALMRLKRYESDVFGMISAFENLYTALEPYASLFTTNDPAVFFVQFNPTNRLRI
jgi:hypothetical protein